MDQNQQGQGPGRRHFHRGRRGPDRRGPERRGPQAAPEQASRNDVDVEQIMRDIRARIAQRHGIELSPHQIQELAARRLESILDPRGLKPGLLDQLRRAAGAPPDPAPKAAEPPYTFEDHTLFESPNGVVRFLRKLLAPILKLFFNPNPLIRALNIQARLNAEAAMRDAERDRRQAEWNALHYELLHRVVSETARVSLEVQSLSLRVESLGGKVDFNERRVRGIEGSMHQARPAGRRDERPERPERTERSERSERPERPERPERSERPDPPPAPGIAALDAAPGDTSSPGAAAAPGQGPGQGPADGTRRRRRRRRGRRGTGAPGEGAPGAADGAPLEADGSAEGEADVDAEAGEPEDGPEEQLALAGDVVAVMESVAIVADAEPLREREREPAAGVVAPAPEQPAPVPAPVAEPPARVYQQVFSRPDPPEVPNEEPQQPPDRSDVDPTER